MRLGVYPGSFNPFHKGHLNILEKAEKIFDKVIVARGYNIEKSNQIEPMPKSLGREVIVYHGLLTDFIESLGHDNVTIIRGLRNAEDFKYELTQFRYLQDLKPDIQLINIFCDKEFDHVSSSGIRLLRAFKSNNETGSVIKCLDKYLVE